eukprot:gene4100-biopygen820
MHAAWAGRGIAFKHRGRASSHPPWEKQTRAKRGPDAGRTISSIVTVPCGPAAASVVSPPGVSQLLVRVAGAHGHPLLGEGRVRLVLARAPDAAGDHHGGANSRADDGGGRGDHAQGETAPHARASGTRLGPQVLSPGRRPAAVISPRRSPLAPPLPLLSSSARAAAWRTAFTPSKWQVFSATHASKQDVLDGRGPPPLPAPAWTLSATGWRHQPSSATPWRRHSGRSAGSPRCSPRFPRRVRMRYRQRRRRRTVHPLRTREKRKRTRAGCGPDAGRTIEFKGTHAGRTRTGRGKCRFSPWAAVWASTSTRYPVWWCEFAEQQPPQSWLPHVNGRGRVPDASRTIEVEETDASRARPGRVLSRFSLFPAPVRLERGAAVVRVVVESDDVGAADEVVALLRRERGEHPRVRARAVLVTFGGVSVGIVVRAIAAARGVAHVVRQLRGLYASGTGERGGRRGRPAVARRVRCLRTRLTLRPPLAGAHAPHPRRAAGVAGEATAPALRVLLLVAGGRRGGQSGGRDGRQGQETAPPDSAPAPNQGETKADAGRMRTGRGPHDRI